MDRDRILEGSGDTSWSSNSLSILTRSHIPNGNNKSNQIGSNLFIHHTFQIDSGVFTDKIKFRNYNQDKNYI